MLTFVPIDNEVANIMKVCTQTVKENPKLNIDQDAMRNTFDEIVQARKEMQDKFNAYNKEKEEKNIKNTFMNSIIRCDFSTTYKLLEQVADIEQSQGTPPLELKKEVEKEEPPKNTDDFSL